MNSLLKILQITKLIFSEINLQRKRLFFMKRTKANYWIILNFLWKNLPYRFFIFSNPFQDHIKAFNQHLDTLDYDDDWFSNNIIFWKKIISQNDLDKKVRSSLEIGSWQGISANYILVNLPLTHLSIVDTFLGSSEHNNENFSKKITSNIEKKFDKNTIKFKKRISKYKQTSYSFFIENNLTKKYDFIYVDGSHYFDDVIVDLLKSFERLNNHGIMIIDDYFWKHYNNILENNAFAINSFLMLKKKEIEIIGFDYQIAIKKIKPT